MHQASEHSRPDLYGDAVPSFALLTAREREVAALVAEGLSNAEIAERLSLTPGTVGNHIGHIMRKLGARNRVQVAVWSVRQESSDTSRRAN